jgi:putative FmdB family regulatory protein
MPFYEYECSNCGYRDEVLQKINDKPLKKCPNCGKNGLKKLMSAPVFRLKGSGWYETDFKTDKDNKRNLAGADKDEAKSESKSESKIDTKPDAKAETKSDSKADVAKPAPVKTATGKSKPKAKASRPAKRPGSRR